MLDDEIAALVRRKTESAHLDYKAGFEWKKDNKDLQLGLLRDMMGMANMQDGGTIVFGVEDGTFNLIGVPEAILTSFDPTDIGQMLYSYSEPKLTFELQKAQVDSKDVVVIRVSEFSDVPIVCTESVCGKDPTKPILRRGAVYVRTPAAQTEEISSAHDMRELLGRALQKRGDEVLRSLANLIKGKPIVPTEEVINRYQAELEEAHQWFIRVKGKGFLSSPHWELDAHPAKYVANRISDLPTLEKLAKEAQVSLRGWPLPYLGRNSGTGMFNSGFQGHVESGEIREAFRLYQSGLFAFRDAFWEDLQDRKTDDGKRTLSFVGVIYAVTEHVLFLKRLYLSVPDVTSVHITVRLIGCNGRVLRSFDPLVPFFDRCVYESHEDQIVFEQNVQLVELQANAEEIAGKIARHIFHVFNWTDVSDDVIPHWQNKLLGLTRPRHVPSS